MIVASRRGVIAAGLGALGAMATRAAAQVTLPVPAQWPVTIKAVHTGAPLVALTFDDGPHPRLTPPLLDLLRARGVRATFFVIGRNAATWPGLVKRIVDEGHEVGNHTWRHPYLTSLSSENVLREFDRTAMAVFQASGKRPVMMRPPYGALTPRQSRMALRERGLPTILWSIDPQDWKRPAASTLTARIVRGAHPGGIVLAHDIHPQTVRAMPATLDQLAAAGYGFATVSQLLGLPDWSTRQFRLAG